MSHHLNQKVTLVGLGAMALEYAKVLKHLNCEVIPIGRSEASAVQFAEKSGLKCFSGGVLKNKSVVSDTAIVAAHVESLAEVTEQLLEMGVKKVLVEKPGALSLHELQKLQTLAQNKKSLVYIAYNRRFMASTQELVKRIKDEGGLQTGYFEFTEWSHVIETLPDSPAKHTTFLSNSTHVVDLAFFLMGKPHQYSIYTSGNEKFTWNKGPSQFVGSGITENQVLFSYHANWTSAGRWGVEVLTKKSRYILRPLEKLFRQPVGSVQVEEIPLLIPEGEAGLKPGLNEQTKAFLGLDASPGQDALVPLAEQIEMFKHYEKINGMHSS